MYKKIATSLIVVLTILNLTGCYDFGVELALSLKEEDHIDLNYLNDDYDVEYQGNIYREIPINLYACDDHVELGWVGGRWWYHYTLYGDSLDDPTFFYYGLHYYYVKESFDFKTEPFNIEGTSKTLVFGEDLLECDEAELLFGMRTSKILIHSVTCPKLKILLNFFEENGQWYASSSNLVAFKLSDRLVDILIENNLIDNSLDDVNSDTV